MNLSFFALAFLLVFAAGTAYSDFTPEKNADHWFFSENYGELLPGSNADITLWRASGARKVPRRRKPPAKKCRGLGLRTAVNEAEAVQLVVTPSRALADVRVKLGVWPVSKSGEELPSIAFDILRVGYVPVTHPSDGDGCAAWWPDPLPPQSKNVKLAVPAAENQPFWIRVKPQKITSPGVYRGSLQVDCLYEDGTEVSLEVPLAVEVFGFAMPDAYACKAVVGIGPDIFCCHNAKGGEMRTIVYDGYSVLAADCHLLARRSGARRKSDEEPAGEAAPGFRRMADGEMWAHICDTSAAQYARGFIDRPGTDLRMALWRAWDAWAAGIAIEQAVRWNSRGADSGRARMRNPYLEAMGWRMENGERTGAGNGAGCFIYPPEKCFARDAENRLTGELGGDDVVFDAPVGSIRLEMVRDGIEDYEYLARLRSLDPDNALLKIPSGIFASPDRYAKDPEPIENHRLKLAREIERLTKKNKED